jgi:hypothetical protein
MGAFACLVQFKSTIPSESSTSKWHHFLIILSRAEGGEGWWSGKVSKPNKNTESLK